MTDELLEQLCQRYNQLLAMGFNSAEIKPILQMEFSYALKEKEFQRVVERAQSIQAEYAYDETSVHQHFNQAVQRMTYVQQVLLSAFQQMIKNYNAGMEGKVEHDPDPDTGEVFPVVAVRPLDLAAMGEKIMKIDNDRLSAMLNYPKALQSAKAALPDTNQKPKSLAQISSQFVADDDDDILEADYEDADYEEA